MRPQLLYRVYVTCLSRARAILTVTHVPPRSLPRFPLSLPLFVSCRDKERKRKEEGGTKEERSREIKEERWYAFARAFNVSALVVKEEHLLPVHRPEDEAQEVEGWSRPGRGVRARVVERQIVRHLTHLIPYLSPSPVTTLIHPFFRHAFLQPDPLTLHTPPTLSSCLPPGPPLHRRRPPRLFPLFLVASRPTSSPPARSLFSRRTPAMPPRLESFRLPTPYKRSCCPFITTTLPRLPRPKDQPSSLTSIPRFSLSSFAFSTVSSLLSVFYHLRRRARRSVYTSSFLRFCSRALPRSLLTL